MKALDTIVKERQYEHELSYGQSVALILQPQSHSDFNQHPEFDEIFRLWTQDDRYRGLDFVRLWSLAMNCKHSLQRASGAVAELGVYQGQSAAVLSWYAKHFQRPVYLCDTFDGFPKEQYEADMGDGKKAAFKDAEPAIVKQRVGTYSNIEWVIGMFPDSITERMARETYAFVSIDCDIYEPILAGLRFFYPRMQPGGMIFVHDYSSGYWPGATRAVDEFCSETGVYGCLLPDLAGTYVITRGK